MGLTAFLLLLLLAAAWGYQLLPWCRCGAFSGLPAARRRPRPARLTVFKPLKGLEANTRECLESFLTQAYDPYQVIFGVRDPADPVVDLLQELPQSYPGPEIDIVVCPENLGLNPKISNLRQMEDRAHYDLLVIADADVKVGPDFLGRVAAALQEPGAGLVSCPYRAGRPPPWGPGWRP